MKYVFLLIFNLTLFSAGASAQSEASSRVRKEGDLLLAAAERTRVFRPDIAGLPRIATYAEVLSLILNSSGLEAQFKYAEPNQVVQYANGLQFDRERVEELATKRDRAAIEALVTGVSEDLRAKVPVPVVATDEVKGKLDESLALLRDPAERSFFSVWVQVSITNRDGIAVRGYQALANPFSRENDRPPNYTFPDSLLLQLSPGYYRFWIEKNGGTIQSQYVSVGTGAPVSPSDAQKVAFEVAGQ